MGRAMAKRTVLAVVLLTVVAACAPKHRTPAPPGSSGARYQLLDARKLGAEVVQQLVRQDAVIRAYVTEEGSPDFLIAAGPNDTQFIYYGSSRLVHFHRGADGRTTASEVSPLPGPLLSVLPSDLAAGTAAPLYGDTEGCWVTAIPDGSCRTCCVLPRGDYQPCEMQCSRAKVKSPAKQ